MIGCTISHYKILEKLGEGGMGVVYRAEDTKLKRTVALKFLPVELTRDEEAKARFVREAQAASALEHPNICTIHEIGETSEGRIFICMSFYPGETLKQKIGAGPLPADGAIDVALQVARGLSRAHEAGVVHRDVKPANIVLTERGEAKILDFGLAKLADRTRLTSMGTTVGTVAYMSPEQARGEEVDHRSDIWSLGVLLYEMLCGRAPFVSTYQQATIYLILNSKPAPLGEHCSSLPSGLEQVIERCLAKDPAARYHTIDDLIADLESIVRRRPLMASMGHASATSGASSAPTPSIAVLPFRDMSADRDQEYFCEGIAEELINALTQIEGLRVAARTSAFQYKDKEADIRRIGRDLDVGAVLEGSVRKAGSRLRITAQLVNVVDGYHLWSEKYDRDLEDIFAIQDEISLAIVKRLRGKLLEEERSKLVRRYTENEEAYNLYLKGRYYWNRRHQVGIQKAIDLFQQAVEKDALYAPGYVGLADCYNVSAILAFMDPKVVYAKSKEAISKALDIDEDLAEAHASLGWIKTFYDWDWAGAEAEYLRAIELNPNYAAAHYFYGLYLCVVGKYDKAMAESSRALELDPIHLVFNTIKAVTLAWSRRHDDAIEQFRKTLDMDPDFFIANLYLGFAFLGKEMWPEAVQSFRKAAAVSPGNPLAVGCIGFALGSCGRKEEALEALDELEELSGKRFVGSYCKALVHLGLEADDRVFECLESAFVERDSWLPIASTLPLWDRVRSDPRFAALVRRLGLRK